MRAPWTDCRNPRVSDRVFVFIFNIADRTHFEVGAKVRKTIEELGGTMPEDLPTAESIKKLAARKRKQLK
jgi:hypothetical protein